MNKEIGEAAQKFLRGQLKQDEFLQAIGAALNKKHSELTAIRDPDLLDFARKFAHFG